MNKATELSLPDVIGVLRRHVIAILVCAFCTAVVAGIVVFALPKRYRASTDLLVLKPTFKQTEADFSELVPEPLSVRTCDLLLKSAGLIEEVFAKSGMREAGDLTVEDFAETLETKAHVEQESQREVIYSPVITLYATADTPEAAKRVVDTWANLFVEKANKIQAVEANEVYNFVDNEFDEIDAALREAEEKLRDFQRENNMDRIKIEKQKQEELLTELQADAARTAVEIDELEQKLAKLEQEKANFPLLLSLAKAITDDPMWLSWLEEKRGADFPEELKAASLLTQELNPTRLAIEQEIFSTQGGLSMRQGRLRMTNEKIDEIKANIESLQRQLAEATMKSRRLSRALNDYTTTHELLVTERDKAKIAAGRTAGDVRIWSPAVLPQKPVYPRNKKLVVVFAFLLGLIISSGYFLARYVALEPQKRQPATSGA